MKIDWFDDVLLKDGREGTVIEVYNDGESFDVEFSSAPDDSDISIVYPHEIERVTRKN